MRFAWRCAAEAWDPPGGICGAVRGATAWPGWRRREEMVKGDAVLPRVPGSARCVEVERKAVRAQVSLGRTR